MFRKLLFIVGTVLVGSTVWAQSGTIRASLFDAETKEPIAFANVIVERDGNQIIGGTTDFDGICLLKPVPAGRFTVKASYVGYSTQQINAVLVVSDEIRFLDVPMTVNSTRLDEVVVIDYKVPLISKDNTQSGGTVTSEEITKMQGRSAEAVAATVGGVYSEDGSVRSVRGAREDATVYYLDGVKMRGNRSLPKGSVEQVSVITGGLQARYGDVTGGVISMVTKGPSSAFFGSFEGHTSQFLTKYNDHMGAITLSGPIYSQKTVDPNNPDNIIKKPIVGFLFSTEVAYLGTTRPSSIGRWAMKENYLDSIKRNPFLPIANTTQLTASYLGAEAYEKVKTVKNTGRFSISANGKIDIKASENANVTLGGTFYFQKEKYDNYQFSFANWDRNQEGSQITTRGYVRFNQRFRSQQDASDTANITLINNINYTLQFDYTKDKSWQGDGEYKDDIFKYGYYGKFHVRDVPTYKYTGEAEPITKLKGYIQDAFIYTLDTIYSTDINPLLAVYNQRYYEYFNPNNTMIALPTMLDLQMGGGYLNGETPDYISIMGLGIGDNIYVPGTVSNGYSISDSDQIHATGHISADIKGHEISAGFEYEKRTDRGYSVAPVGLWTLARQLTNNHILELDFSNPLPLYLMDNNGNYIKDQYGNNIFTDTINYPRLRASATQSVFDINFREHLGLSYDDVTWLNVDGQDPSNMSIDFFSADELYNNGSNPYVIHYGFDHKGNKINGRTTFNDFFTSQYADANGNLQYNRLIPAYEPIYMAGYIQDKFAFNDLVFNIGLRVDYYDLNQKVLKDPYLFFETYKVGDDLPDNLNSEHPRNVPQGSAIYVNNVDDPTQITSYRNGSTWYDAQGNVIDANMNANSEVSPYLVDGANVGSQSFLNSFEDYKPEIVPMPRIAFSFPISDEALFYAHYDILTKRPAVDLGMYQDFLYIKNKRNELISNPNVRPEKTIAYELGFQQKVSETSSIKISAFYREMRDMIQVQSFAGAYPVSYITYGNLDFGTVKGLTLTYDLRRTGNVSLRGAYTLQFAKGTGSGSQTALNLIRAGYPNLRTIYPLNFDSRHQISVVFDYRFSEGADYNGPKIAGKDILSNTGLNVTFQMNSGTPYTMREHGTNFIIGQLNGNSMPWTNTVNLRLDKDINVKIGEKDGKAKTGILNVYLDISNIFDTRNIASVYSTTGNPNDNGWLTFSNNQEAINSQPDPDVYRYLYAMYINSPSNYRMPRTIRIGAMFSF